MILGALLVLVVREIAIYSNLDMGLSMGKYWLAWILLVNTVIMITQNVAIVKMIMLLIRLFSANNVYIVIVHYVLLLYLVIHAGMAFT